MFPWVNNSINTWNNDCLWDVAPGRGGEDMRGHVCTARGKTAREFHGVLAGNGICLTTGCGQRHVRPWIPSNCRNSPAECTRHCDRVDQRWWIWCNVMTPRTPPPLLLLTSVRRHVSLTLKPDVFCVFQSWRRYDRNAVCTGEGSSRLLWMCCAVDIFSMFINECMIQSRSVPLPSGSRQLTDRTKQLRCIN